jgi:hypothetical protein
MERRNFIKTSAVVAAAATASVSVSASETQVNPPAQKEIYEWKVYHFKNGGAKTKVETFYKQALMPYMKKKGVTVGAFGEYSLTEPPVIYYLLVYPSMAEYQAIKKDMWKDADFLAAGKGYFETTAELGTFTRFETYLMEAFDAIPKLRLPAKNRGLFELRTYESNNEEAAQRKIKMFNSEELGIFDKVGLKSNFFGEILAGPQMPALMYLLDFTDMAERTALWKKFGESPEWNTLKAKPEFAFTVSVVNKIFLLPLEYSQI